MSSKISLTAEEQLQVEDNSYVWGLGVLRRQLFSILIPIFHDYFMQIATQVEEQGVLNLLPVWEKRLEAFRIWSTEDQQAFTQKTILKKSSRALWYVERYATLATLTMRKTLRLEIDPYEVCVVVDPYSFFGMLAQSIGRQLVLRSCAERISCSNSCSNTESTPLALSTSGAVNSVASSKRAPSIVAAMVKDLQIVIEACLMQSLEDAIAWDALTVDASQCLLHMESKHRDLWDAHSELRPYIEFHLQIFNDLRRQREHAIAVAKREAGQIARHHASIQESKKPKLSSSLPATADEEQQLNGIKGRVQHIDKKVSFLSETILSFLQEFSQQQIQNWKGEQQARETIEKISASLSAHISQRSTAQDKLYELLNTKLQQLLQSWEELRISFLNAGEVQHEDSSSSSPMPDDLSSIPIVPTMNLPHKSTPQDIPSSNQSQTRTTRMHKRLPTTTIKTPNGSNFSRTELLAKFASESKLLDPNHMGRRPKTLASEDNEDNFID